jgi:CRISPR/Cas system-associated exonuclease Cas4 (RecB family)
MVLTNAEFKKFLEAKNRPYRLLGDIERHVLTQPPGDRRTDVLHPSEIIKKDWCLRGSYYLLMGETKVQEKHGLRLQSIFDEGHAIHAKWQRWFHDMGVLHGNFECSACKSRQFGTSIFDCTECGFKNTMQYAEVTLVDETLRIAGHTDGWIRGIGEDCLIEIKSIGPGTIRAEAPHLIPEAGGDFMKAWNQVRRPFNSHLLQGQMYLELMKRMGNDVKEIVFLYELKADQSYKEFSIKSDYELVRHIFESAEKLKGFIEQKTPPPCSNNAAGQCKHCSPYGGTE